MVFRRRRRRRPSLARCRPRAGSALLKEARVEGLPCPNRSARRGVRRARRRGHRRQDVAAASDPRSRRPALRTHRSATPRPASGTHGASSDERRSSPCRTRGERYGRVLTFSSVLVVFWGLTRQDMLLPAPMLPKTVLIFAGECAYGAPHICRPRTAPAGKNRGKTKRPPAIDGLSSCRRKRCTPK